MTSGLKFRFYPTPEQELTLARSFARARYVQFRFQPSYDRKQRANSGNSSPAAVPTEPGCAPPQQSLRCLMAVAKFGKKRASWWMLRKRQRSQSAEFIGSAFTWDNGELKLAKIGRLTINWSRRPSRQPNTISITKTASGRYYVSFPAQ